MAATLRSIPPAPLADPVDKLREVVELLRTAGTRSAREAADALDAHLTTGAPLERLLGLSVRRGGAHDKAHRRASRAQRDQLITDLAADVPGTVTHKAKVLSAMLAAGHPKTKVFRQRYPDAPASVPQLVRILRG